MSDKTLLIIDDDVDDILFLTDAFLEKKCGYDILSFQNAADAFFELANLNPEKFPILVITDLNMPGMNGFEFLKQMKAHKTLNRIPVVISSNSSLESNKATCMQLGAKAYFVKPFAFKDYLPFVEEVLSILTNKNNLFSV